MCLRSIYLLVLIWVCCLSLTAQKNEDFSEEVAMISEKYEAIKKKGQKTVVFTGSSSIRLWNELERYFPDYQIVNSGFGGSEALDLLKFINPLILDCKPEKVFIYEGDNDISFRRSPARVLRTTRKILNKIWTEFPRTEIVLIAAKPSPERWHLKRRYMRLNRKFEEFANSSPQVDFANVWDVMLQGEEIDNSLFEEDGLHMNEKGYALWYEVLKSYLY